MPLLTKKQLACGLRIAIFVRHAHSRFGVVVDRGVLVNCQRGRVQCDGVSARLVLLGRGLDS